MGKTGVKLYLCKKLLMAQKTLLMILDGWGNASDPTVSAVDLADTPFIESLYKNYSHSTLRTDGEHVGLPSGQMGNSEVGHMNLGAGRIVYQDLAKINKAVKENTLQNEKVLKDAFSYAKGSNKKVHFLGLLSDGGVHSHISHLENLLEVTAASGVSNFYVHAFTDGRDVDPHSGANFVKRIQEKMKKTGGTLASVVGRYYAMDRDQRWERIKKVYDLLLNGDGSPSSDLVESLKNSYEKKITDEFIEPHFLADENQHPVAKIETGDVVLFFNFRTDRGRELTEVLSQKAFPEFNMEPLLLHYVTLTNYDASFEDIKVIFDKENLTGTLGETLANANKTQVRIAETEKYPHVTFFFNGGREIPFKGEDRILCPSPKVATYDLQPEMSALDVQQAIVDRMEQNAPDFICLNFANPDMVGHTGNLQAAIKACETVDQCAHHVVKTALEKNYVCIIIADHGNCETMKNTDGSPNTAHTTNPVPIILVDNQKRAIRSGVLANVAPTILDLMDIPKPKAMTENSLLETA